jgi:N-methylhydantoinase A/oxoprolinase/acetone carboxylase beta subunit
MTTYRIGIDVGGTFTHAVAVDAAALTLTAKVKTPTTHRAAEGVARGVVETLRMLMQAADITPGQIRLIAHSTTQATNALLEGDVATVGIVGMGRGAGAWFARRQTNIRGIPLGSGRTLATHHEFLRSPDVNEAVARAAIARLREQGAEVIVAAEAFSVDDPAREELVCRVAAEMGLVATASHVVSGLHGLALRTRTAVVNASMMPRMLATAEMTEQAVREAGIAAPLMVMRSDGGVMSLAEMRRRPILTMLSGPAAGVAAALLYAQVSDGVFLEVGGTSTDISVIRHGRTQLRSAEIGGHRLSINTLDVRTVGVAGGSLVRVEGGRIGHVGPRSAHIAGLAYLSFAEGDTPDPTAGRHAVNGDEYLAVNLMPGSAGAPLAVTPTCAANRLGLVPPGDAAEGRPEAIARGFDAVARSLGLADGAAAAEAILATAAEPVERIVREIAADYALDPGAIKLVGGGGGAAAIVPMVAREMGVPYEAVPDADVISAIGVALAMVREVVERSSVDPGPAELCAVRDEAAARVLRMGAAPETIEVYVEVDRRSGLIRGTAEGSLEVCRAVDRRRPLDESQRRQLVAGSIGHAVRPPECVARRAGFELWSAPVRRHRWGRLFPVEGSALRVLDAAGTIRWSAEDGAWAACRVDGAARELETLAARHTRYSDAGASMPGSFVVVSGRIIDLSGLADVAQAIAVLGLELSRCGPDEECAVLVKIR